ncbi:MAG: Hsp20/alpha crystallin family protein [Verrucomicrobiia bacterium]
MKQTLEKEAPKSIERTAAAEFVSPGVNIYEMKDGYLLEAEMPGVGKDGLEITLEGNELTITGRRNVENADGELLFRERSRLEFQRTFELDPAIDTARINAKINQGLLTLSLPKSEEVKPRRIAVSE